MPRDNTRQAATREVLSAPPRSEQYKWYTERQTTLKHESIPTMLRSLQCKSWAQLTGMSRGWETFASELGRYTCHSHDAR